MMIRTLLLAAAFVATAAFAGGFQIKVEHAPDSADAVVRDAVLVVRALGCHQPSQAKITAKAEGIVDGKRVSRTLRLRPVSDGVYAIHREWPSEGRWVLAISGVYRGHTSSALVDAGPGDELALPARMFRGEVSRRDVDAALALASN